MTLRILNHRSLAGQSGPETHPPQPTEAETAGDKVAENLTVSEARDLLDWLEGHGIRASEVDTDAAGRITIRWTM
jgi:hypothetical protein